jgi:hypothetical protein
MIMFKYTKEGDAFFVHQADFIEIGILLDWGFFENFMVRFFIDCRYPEI